MTTILSRRLNNVLLNQTRQSRSLASTTGSIRSLTSFYNKHQRTGVVIQKSSSVNKETKAPVESLNSRRNNTIANSYRNMSTMLGLVIVSFLVCLAAMFELPGDMVSRITGHNMSAASSSTSAGGADVSIPTPNTSVNLILPPTETRPHRHLILPNSLEVVLISDPDSDKSAAALDVGVGHLEDPANLPGCAHFCEHMLFLGTKRFPKENEYNGYLTNHNGHSNAYTDLCNTNYYFEVAPDALGGALDRFSGFFTEPMFAEDCTEREANAVNSEHKKNLQADMWRFYQLEKHLSSPTHPYNKFGTGNLETLWTHPKAEDRDPRAELIQWWEKEYCSQRMKLVVLGKESLDTLEKWIRDRFEKVPNKGKGVVMYQEEVFEPEQMGHIVFVEPVRDTRGLEITFPFPDQRQFYKSKPGSYLAHFLGHEGPGSILSYLKRKGWVNNLRSGAQNGSSGFELFKITVDLTEDGLVNYEKVAQTIYKYISLLKSNPPSEETFNEIKALADIGFRFVERGQASSYVSDLARQLHQPVPREKVISSQWLVEKFDPVETAKTLERLDVRKSNIAISSRTLPPGIEGDFDLVEPIYSTKYKKVKMSQAFIDEALNGTVPELHLPGKNAFIPENLDVKKIEVESPKLAPELIQETPLSKLWYKKDDRYWIPRANVFMSLKSPLLQVTPRNAVLARIFVDMFKDSIAEETYDAELAGLQFSLDYSGDRLIVGTVGYNDKLYALTEKILRTLKSFKVDPTRFELIRDQLRRYWKNFVMEEPYELVAYYAHYAQAETMWTMKEKAEELEFCTPEAVERLAQEVFARLHIEGLIHGNVEKQAALDIQKMVEDVLQPRTLASAEKLAERSLLLPESSQHVWQLDVENPSNVNSALDYYCEVGDIRDDYLRPRLSLLASLVSEPTFNTLRTKEQLGYIVHSGARASTGSMGLNVLVQSERDSVYLETRVEALFDHLKEFLDNLEEGEFEKHKTGVINKKLEKPKNLHGEASRFWGAIGDGYYDFERRFRDAELTQTVTKQEIIDLFMERVHYSSPIRRKLSTHMRSTYKGVKFDPARAGPIVEAFMIKQVPVDQAAVGALLASSPGVADIQKFARDCLAQADHLSEEDRQALDKQVADLDTVNANVSDKDAKLREGNVVIDNIVEFKATLLPSKAPVAMKKFNVV